MQETIQLFSKIWSGKLGTIDVEKHNIGLYPDSKSFRYLPHRAGTKSRDIESYEVQRMLKEEVIEN